MTLNPIHRKQPIDLTFALVCAMLATFAFIGVMLKPDKRVPDSCTKCHEVYMDKGVKGLVVYVGKEPMPKGTVCSDCHHTKRNGRFWKK